MRLNVIPPWWSAALCLLVASGCAGDCLRPPSSDDNSRDPPLQPLVYTETADASPQAAAVRERRLLRQLRTGAEQSGDWGGLERSTRDLPTLKTPEALGRALGRALLQRDDVLWSHLFVPASGYAKLVDLDEQAATQFVDKQRAVADDTWRAFDIETPSKLPPDGLTGAFELGELDLGAPRTLDGGRASNDQRPIQYWNNRLQLTHPATDLQFSLKIAKIIRIPRALSTSGQPRFGVAGKIELGRPLDIFLSAGLHFDADLLSGADYPFPLNVGTFWKYRRTERTAVDADNTDTSQSETDAPDASKGEDILVEVVKVDRFNSWRVVHLRALRLDRKGGRRDTRWLLTPRQIYHCDAGCRRAADNPDRLLQYIDRATPLFTFPMGPGDAWSASDRQERPKIKAGDSFQTIESPAGLFSGSIRLTGSASGISWSVDGSPDRVRRWFAPRMGVVQREFEFTSGNTTRRITDKLTEFRLMER